MIVDIFCIILLVCAGYRTTRDSSCGPTPPDPKAKQQKERYFHHHCCVLILAWMNMVCIRAVMFHEFYCMRGNFPPSMPSFLLLRVM